MKYLFLTHRVTFNVPTGALVAVVGSVGSGKSTLIQSVLGETKRMCGRLQLNVSFLIDSH